MIRIWGRYITRAWHREFRRRGYQMLNSFALHFQAKEKKYQLNKLKEEFNESTKPPKPNITVNSVEDIPNIQYIREKIKAAIEVVEKVHGPLRFSIKEAEDGNPFHAKVDMNEEGYRALWLELLKDPKDVPMITQAIQIAYELGLNLMQVEAEKKGEVKTIKEKIANFERKKEEEGEVVVGEKKEIMDALIEPKDRNKIDMCLKEMENILISDDLRRVDIGLIISRPPIFLQ